MKIRTSVYVGALTVKRFVTITVAWILIIMTLWGSPFSRWRLSTKTNPWGVMHCSLVYICQCFGFTSHFHFYGRRGRQRRHISDDGSLRIWINFGAECRH